MNVPAFLLGASSLVLATFAIRAALSSWTHLTGRVMVLGDSVTAHGGYVAVLQRAFPRLTFENHGVVGQSTRAMLDRARPLLTPGAYAGVIVMGGLNDGDRPAAWTTGNLSAIYQAAKAAGARVAALSETPVSSYPSWTSGAQARAEGARRWVLAKPTHVDVAVDTWGPIKGHREYYAPDGLHLNAAGQAALGQAVVRKLR
jgi:lysophospholipase L1-like esterase